MTKPRKPQGRPADASRPGVDIPSNLRVGGAFTALAAVLFLMGVMSLIFDGVGAVFEWTPRRVVLLVAALLVGAFATQRKDQRASRAQVLALGAAVILIGASVVLPAEPLMLTGQYMPFAYGVAALLCALVIRRTAA